MENLICPLCGGILGWGSDAMCNECSDNYSYDDTAVVGFYTRSTCGRSYEIYDPPKEERETVYKDFWDKN